MCIQAGISVAIRYAHIVLVLVWPHYWPFTPVLYLYSLLPPFANYRMIPLSLGGVCGGFAAITVQWGAGQMESLVLPSSQARRYM